MPHPFGTPELVIEDLIRLAIVLLGTTLLFVYIRLTVNVGRRRFTNATGWGLLAQLFAAAFIVGTEVERIGHSIFESHFWWRLPVGALAMVFMVKTVLEVGRYPKDPPWGRSE